MKISQDTMLILQEDWQKYSVFCMVGVVLVYLCISVGLIVFARKCQLDVFVFGFIPVLNLLIPFRVLLKKHRDKKEAERIKRETETFDEDEEIEL